MPNNACTHAIRHYTDIAKSLGFIKNAYEIFGDRQITITGYPAVALADYLHIPFLQGSHRRHQSRSNIYPQSDVIIELGGEDAKSPTSPVAMSTA